MNSESTHLHRSIQLDCMCLAWTRDTWIAMKLCTVLAAFGSLFGASSPRLFAMFDDMDWDMEAAADQEEEFLSGPPADEEDWCFGVPPEDQAEPESVEEPHAPIACGLTKAEGPSEVQKEPAPVQLPIAENASIPEIGKFKRLNKKTTDARDWPVRVSPSPAAPAKAAVPEAGGDPT